MFAIAHKYKNIIEFNMNIKIIFPTFYFAKLIAFINENQKYVEYKKLIHSRLHKITLYHNSENQNLNKIYFEYFSIFI